MGSDAMSRRRSRPSYAAATAVLTGPDGVDTVDYAALVDPDSFEDLPAAATGAALLTLAVHVGATRLIDNTELTLRRVVSPADPVRRRAGCGGMLTG